MLGLYPSVAEYHGDIFCRQVQEKQGGAAIIEFSLVLPVFLFAFVSILYFGVVYFAGQSVQWAAQRGADSVLVVEPGQSKTAFGKAALSQVRERLSHVAGVFPGHLASPELATMMNDRCGGPDRGSYVCITRDAGGTVTTWRFGCWPALMSSGRAFPT